MIHAQEAIGTFDSARGVREAGQRDLPRSEGSGQEGDATKGTNEKERILRALTFVCRHFADEYIGDNVTACEAAHVIETITRELFGLAPPSGRHLYRVGSDPSLESVINDGVDFVPQLRDLIRNVRQALLVY
jgi:hypothetical protein